jgi:hypothetical protein
MPTPVAPTVIDSKTRQTLQDAAGFGLSSEQAIQRCPTSGDRAICAGLQQAADYLAKRASNCQVMIANEGIELKR